MIAITTNDIHGKNIKKYLDIVSGEAIMEVQIRKNTKQQSPVISRDGRSKSYERTVRIAKEIALDEMKKKAEKSGADAVIGVSLDYGVIDVDGMLMVIATGTAVKCG